jgi:hypothetical protein
MSISALDKLAGLAVTDNKQKVLNLYLTLAGDKLLKRSNKAVELLDQGKDFGRALADSLESK